MTLAQTSAAIAGGRVLVFGSLNIDFTVKVPGLPTAGQTVIGDSLLISPGGKGANQAGAAARLGAATRLLGRVGADEYGRTLIEASRSDGVDVSGVLVDLSQPTGAALIVVEESGQNIIAVSRGANGAVGDSDVRRLAESVRPGDVVCFQLEVPASVVNDAAAMARRAGAMTILNAAPSTPLKGHPMREIDVLIVNESEAGDLAGGHVHNLIEAERAARQLQSQWPCVVVTLGSRGAMLIEADELIRIEPFEVESRDATGAGDAFVGGFACGAARGLPRLECATLACAAGAAAVTQIGARKSLPTASDLEKMFGITIDPGSPPRLVGLGSPRH